MKSTLRVLSGLVIVLALLMTMSVYTVSAQGPSGTATPTPAQAPAAPGTNLDNPGSAATLGSAVAAIPAHTGTWFRFDYSTNGNTFPRPLMNIRLVNGVTNGLGFDVWSPERLQSDYVVGNDHPVGRGTPEKIPGCNVTLPDDSVVRCTSKDLTWVGGFGADGTYYVRVFNKTNDAIAPQVIFSGPGLAQCLNPNQAQAQTTTQGTDQGFTQVQCGTVVAGLNPVPAGAPSLAPTETPAAAATSAATSAPAATSTTAATSSAPSAATPEATSTPAAAPSVVTETPAASSTTASSTPSAGAMAPVTGLKVTQNTTLGPILTDDAGRTVYAFLNDTSSASNCNGNCAQNWPPLAASASAMPTAGTGLTASMLGTINRADGTTQLTYNGHPLYYFAKDVTPGDANGQGVGGNWWTLKPDGSLNQASTSGTSATPAASATP